MLTWRPPGEGQEALLMVQPGERSNTEVLQFCSALGHYMPFSSTRQLSLTKAA